MRNAIAQRLFELLTGKPYTTVRSMAAEFGPPPAARYPELARYSDWELCLRDLRGITAEIEARRAQSPTEVERLLIDTLTGAEK